jgi:hypothetical protein
VNEQLRVGDRVRVTEANRASGYQPGDTGHVTWAPPGGGPQPKAPLTLCEMDRTGACRLAAFYPGEIEKVP